MTSVPRNRVLVALTALAALVLVACGGGDADTGGDATTPPAGGDQGAPAPDGGLTVSEALASDLDEPLTVTGFLIETDEGVRLCETVMESFPPQCGEPSLEVRGVDVGSLEDAQNQSGVTWVDRATLTGEVEDGILTVSDTSVGTATSSGTPTPDAGDPLRDLIVAPQEPRTVAPGETAEFAVPGRLGGDALPSLVGFGWVPCATVDATQPGALAFPDPDDDGVADRMGTSEEAGVLVEAVNGEAFENVDDVWPVALHTRDDEPSLVVTLRSERSDCATVVFFLDEDADEELDLAGDDTPAEVYGVGGVRWES